MNYGMQAAMWDWMLFLLVFTSGAWLGFAVTRVFDWWRERKRYKP